MDTETLIVHEYLFDAQGRRCEHSKPHPRSKCGHHLPPRNSYTDLPQYVTDAARAELDARVACYADKSVGMMLPVREVESMTATIAALLDEVANLHPEHHEGWQYCGCKTALLLRAVRGTK